MPTLRVENVNLPFYALFKSLRFLTFAERAELAAFLIDTLEIEHHSVDDAEVARRPAELAGGEVKGLSWEQVKAASGRI